jgi:NhaA family Na+:H+ antiporter
MWAPINALLVMPLFALANTAIPLTHQAAALALPPSATPISLGIGMGLLLGKPMGIFVFSQLAIRLGLCRLPEEMNKRHLATVGMLGSIGFTMSLLLVDKSVSGALAVQGKLAVIIASSTAALISAGIMSRFPRFMSTRASTSTDKPAVVR